VTSGRDGFISSLIPRETAEIQMAQWIPGWAMPEGWFSLAAPEV